jgi:DNA-binding HxlR family transcriptional regulator
MNHCPIQNALKLFGGKWKIAVLYSLKDGPKRFGILKKSLNGITQQMLTKQLRELERDSLINRKAFDVIPPKVEYSLTDFGDSLIPVLNKLCGWSSAHEELIDAIIFESVI